MNKGNRNNKPGKPGRPDGGRKEGERKSPARPAKRSDARPKRDDRKRDEGSRDGKRPYPKPASGDDRNRDGKRPYPKPNPRPSSRDDRRGSDDRKSDDSRGEKRPYPRPASRDGKPGAGGYKGRSPYPRSTPRPRPVKSESDDVRLNKFLANSGLCSRREADELIRTGLVSVNGVVVTELGSKVKPTDEVRYDGRVLKGEKPVYVVLNKPKDFVTTVKDPKERKTVMQLVKNAGRERIYPVGRLDRQTTGVLMFTNDGDLAERLTHPRYGARKIYHVHLDNPLEKADFDQIKKGIYLEEGKVVVDEIALVGDGNDRTQVGLEIHIGWNRVVRRIFEKLGYKVIKLDRVMFAGLTKKDLSRGQWRYLTSREINMLKSHGEC
ncbi:MAG: pseudouridine synthase [Flavobacteriales bacterium]|nr:pseudouridine synthase [Flavobacteriales bacterium]